MERKSERERSSNRHRESERQSRGEGVVALLVSLEGFRGCGGWGAPDCGPGWKKVR